MNKDLFGQALLDYFHQNSPEDIITWTSISDKDTLPVSYLFRDYDQMPRLEQQALMACKGITLDVGCGSGSHSLWLQKKGLKVKAIDISEGAISVTRSRGLINCECIALLDETQCFDTILLLMNGIGIFKELHQVTHHLRHLKSLLNPNGQILIDSSDIIYMYEDEDGGTWLDVSKDYYGNLDYFISYKGVNEHPMKWLYLDYERLTQACLIVGLHCEKLMDGSHYDYLARITILSEQDPIRT